MLLGVSGILRMLADLNGVGVVDVRDGEANGTPLRANLAQVREARRRAHEGQGGVAAVVRVLAVCDVALGPHAGRDGVLIVGEGYDAVCGKAGDYPASDGHSDLLGVVGADFRHGVFLLSLTR